MATKIIKLVLSVALFLCLLDMEYGYYQLVRFLSFIGFGYFSIQCFNHQNIRGGYIYLALAILFQPFFKIALGREIWNIVDVLVGVGLLISIKKE